MSLPITFATLAGGNQPLSLFDTQFAAVAALGIIPCAASGQNAVVLTPNANTPALSSYTDLTPKFAFVAAQTSTGVVTISAAGLGSRNAYAVNGSTQIGTSGIQLIAGNVYVATPLQALNVGAGGFVVDVFQSAIAPRGYISGVTLSGGGSQTLTIAAGQVTSDDTTTTMLMPSTFTKTFAAWAVGTGNGGLDTGSIAINTWYHVYIIERLDTFVVDVLISVSATTPTLPANYTVKRRIGSIKTDGTPNIIAFSQNGDEFLWAAPPTDINTAALGTTATLFALSTPLGVKTNALIRGAFTNAANNVIGLINSPDENSIAGGSLAGTGNATAIVTVAGVPFFFTVNVRTNTSSQIRGVASAAATSLTEATTGWVDTRGRFS